MLEYTMEASLDGLSEVGSFQMAKLEPGPVELRWVAKRGILLLLELSLLSGTIPGTVAFWCC